MKYLKDFGNHICISAEKKSGKFDHYILNMYCKIYNYNYTIEGTFKSLKEISSNCGCKYCGSSTKEAKIYRAKKRLKILEEKDFLTLPGVYLQFLILENNWPKKWLKLIQTISYSDDRQKILEELKNDEKNIINGEDNNDDINDNYENDNYIPTDEDLSDSKELIEILHRIGNHIEINVDIIGDKLEFIIKDFLDKYRNNHYKEQILGSNETYIKIQNEFNSGNITKLEKIVYSKFLDRCKKIEKLKKNK